MSLPKLYGLFVAIDEYQYVGNLGGCKADISQVMDYFATLADGQFDFQTRKLTDKQATKKNVVNAFQEHLIAQAGPGDVALMYYSGHGAQETASQAFLKSENDGKLEGVVCHDSGKAEGAGTMLIDKEQRYLIWQLAQKGCEVITIFDSCHSADNTRSTQGDVEMPKRRIAAVMPERKWSDFIFADTSDYNFDYKISEHQLETEALDDILPQGRHVQIAACQDHEFAYETSAGGAFTQGLLKALKDSQGKLSYLDLQSRVRFSIKGRTGGVNQTPQMYYLYGHEEDAFKEFLSGVVQDRPLYANVVFNKNRQEWILDKGSIHGLGRMVDGEDQLVVVPIKGKKTVTATVKEVRPAESVLHFDTVVEDDFLDFNAGYQGFVRGMLSEPLYLWLEGAEAGVKAIQQHLADKTTADQWKNWNLYLAKTKEEASFRILANEAEGDKKAHFAITELDDPRPLVKQSLGLGAPAIKNLEGNLSTLSRWYFAKQLKNPRETALPAYPIRLTVLQNGTELPVENGVITVAHDDPKAEMPKTKIKIKLENTSNQLLHVAALYLDRDWSMTFKLVQQGVAKLEPGGEPLWLFGGKEIPLKWKDSKKLDLVAYQVPFDELFIKVIAATDSFQADLFQQKGIDRALTPKELAGGTRSLDLDDDDENESEPIATNDWTSQLFTLRTPNPRL